MISPQIFEEFPRWSGEVPPNHHADFVGSLTPDRYFGRDINPKGGATTPDLPERNEEYFEWHALLESVHAADRTFTMIEAGAGFGRWTARAACIARRSRPDLALHLIAIEPEPTHFLWLREHLAANGAADVKCFQAALNATGAPTTFTVGHAAEWYGQAAVAPGANFGDWPEARIETVPGMTLNAALKEVPHVDLLDMDIQDAEADCVPHSIRAMTAKVKRAFVATHSQAAREQVVRAFTKHHWSPVASYPHGETKVTEIGPVSFGDGVEYWVNSIQPSLWRRFSAALGR